MTRGEDRGRRTGTFRTEGTGKMHPAPGAGLLERGLRTQDDTSLGNYTGVNILAACNA